MELDVPGAHVHVLQSFLEAWQRRQEETGMGGSQQILFQSGVPSLLDLGTCPRYLNVCLVLDIT